MTDAIVKHETGALEPGAWNAMREQAKALVLSGFMPKAINTPEKAIAVAMAGRELGIPMMQAIRSIHIVDGKPVMSADLMAALVYKRIQGATLRVVESSNEKCIIQAGRDEQLTTFTFSIEDAKRAGLLVKDNWKNYPRAMLRARCIAETVRAVFPDCLVGVYIEDEVGAGGFGESPNSREPITPHALPGEDPDAVGDPEVLAGFMKRLTAIEAAVDSIESYEDTSEPRKALGTHAKQSELSREIQAASESGALGPAGRRQAGAKWQSLNRKLSKIEEALDPGSAAAFVDGGSNAAQ